MVTPFFGRKRLLWVGIVDRIDDKGVGWGDAEGSVQTFDFGMPEEYGVGTQVELHDHRDDDETDYDFMLAAIHESRQRVMMYHAVEADNEFGMTYVNWHEFFKDN